MSAISTQNPNSNEPNGSIRKAILQGCRKIERLNDDDRKDVVQDVLLAYMQLSDERKAEIRNEAAYFYRAGRNEALKRFRRSELSLSYAENLPEPADEVSDGPDADPELLRRVSVISNLFMCGLRGGKREIFRMHFFEDLKNPQIAEKTGYTIESVKTILCALKKELRMYSYKYLSPYFFLD